MHSVTMKFKTDSVNTDHSDGTKMERWRNGKETHNVNRPYYLGLVPTWCV